MVCLTFAIVTAALPSIGCDALLGLEPGHRAEAEAGVMEDTLAWWRLDEHDGNTAADASGNGHLGTFANSPTFVADGKHGGARDFDGSDDYVSIADAPDPASHRAAHARRVDPAEDRRLDEGTHQHEVG